jgi:hypothetical protein
MLLMPRASVVLIDFREKQRNDRSQTENIQTNQYQSTSSRGRQHTNGLAIKQWSCGSVRAKVRIPLHDVRQRPARKVRCILQSLNVMPGQQHANR